MSFFKGSDGNMNPADSTFEEMGIKLRLNDFKMLFDVLDYDNRGTIDFSKFCHLNADRYTLIDLSRMVRIQSIIIAGEHDND